MFLLFRDVNLTKVLLLSESVPKLFKLYDNYEPFTGRPEIETIEEKNELKDFLDVIIKSKPMDMLYTLLKSKDHPIAKNQSVFRHSLEQLWFGQYSRSLGQPDSSGFEHVFIGEFELNGCQITLISYELVQQGRLFIGSMYPSAGLMTNECRRSRDLFN
uniref:Endoribonuclease n=1 Tax=Meloidogyne javanica TaxID=6303 RepID=A0A915MS01_MELJA